MPNARARGSDGECASEAGPQPPPRSRGQGLVPAAAVIPAPIAYINVVAVKKLVVEMKGSCVMNTFVYFVILLPSF